MEPQDVETVAERASEAGFSGPDASPAISLGEYYFVAKEKEQGEYTLLLHVPDGYPGAPPGFKFVTVDESDLVEFAHDRAPLSAYGYHDPGGYVQNEAAVNRLFDYVQESHLFAPMSYFDEPMNAGELAQMIGDC